MISRREQLILDRYRELKSLRKVSEDMGVSHELVRNILKVYGEPLQKRGGVRKDDKKIEAARLKEQGVPIYEIAKRLGHTYDYTSEIAIEGQKMLREMEKKVKKDE